MYDEIYNLLLKSYNFVILSYKMQQVQVYRGQRPIKVKQSKSGRPNA